MPRLESLGYGLGLRLGQAPALFGRAAGHVRRDAEGGKPRLMVGATVGPGAGAVRAGRRPRAERDAEAGKPRLRVGLRLGQAPARFRRAAGHVRRDAEAGKPRLRVRATVGPGAGAVRAGRRPRAEGCRGWKAPATGRGTVGPGAGAVRAGRRPRAERDAEAGKPRLRVGARSGQAPALFGRAAGHVRRGMPRLESPGYGSRYGRARRRRGSGGPPATCGGMPRLESRGYA
jgi:hypothetical protein